jgi:hypothetical protein
LVSFRNVYFSSPELFRCYVLILPAWANSPKFPVPGSGLDPIIGQNKGSQITTLGFNPKNTNAETTFDTFVVPMGGEYFLSPSIPVLTKMSDPKAFTTVKSNI